MTYALPTVEKNIVLVFLGIAPITSAPFPRNLNTSNPTRLDPYQHDVPDELTERTIRA